MSSAQRGLVEHMYSLAGLDLTADLSTLTANLDIAPSEQGFEWMLKTSTPRGELQMPLLATHTVVDLLAPVEFQEPAMALRHQGGQGYKTTREQLTASCPDRATAPYGATASIR